MRYLSCTILRTDDNRWHVRHKGAPLTTCDMLADAESIARQVSFLADMAKAAKEVRRAPLQLEYVQG